MLTPEFVNPETGSYIFVANHSVENAKALELSISFNLARIRYAISQLPKHINKCTLVYDLRGQNVPAGTLEKLRSSFPEVDNLKVMT